MKRISSVQILGFMVIAFAFVLVEACSKDDDDPQPAITSGNIDSVLFVQSHAAAESFLPYQNKDTIRAKATASGHTSFFKVRLNAKARSVLGADGRLPAGSTFPEGSIIVKDLYTSATGALEYVAIMKKEAANPFADKGWLWSEQYGDGRKYVDAKEKGVQCVSCHSANSRDYVRVFDLF